MINKREIHHPVEVAFYYPHAGSAVVKHFMPERYQFQPMGSHPAVAMALELFCHKYWRGGRRFIDHFYGYGIDSHPFIANGWEVHVHQTDHILTNLTIPYQPRKFGIHGPTDLKLAIASINYCDPPWAMLRGEGPDLAIDMGSRLVRIDELALTCPDSSMLILKLPAHLCGTRFRTPGVLIKYIEVVDYLGLESSPYTLLFFFKGDIDLDTMDRNWVIFLYDDVGVAAQESARTDDPSYNCMFASIDTVNDLVIRCGLTSVTTSSVYRGPASDALN